mmetsp:Transcript_5126/g.14327  ORF Transcript_5126/g.14327 Transcript_5126/m.14327 type:complete len:311 (+) Transcript_5126:1050-1982(+)
MEIRCGHRSVKASLEIIVRIARNGVRPVGEGAAPETRGIVQSPCPKVNFHALCHVHQQIPPPVDHEPSGRLPLIRQQLDERTLLLLRRRLYEPVEQMIHVHHVNVELLARRLCRAWWSGITPSMTALFSEAHHFLQKWKSYCTLLTPINVALEGELLLHLRDMTTVVGACKRKLCKPFCLRFQFGGSQHLLLLPYRFEVRHKAHVATSPLPSRLLQKVPDLLAAAHDVIVYHVNFPPWPHAQLLRLVGHAQYDSSVVLESMAATSVAKFKPAHCGARGRAHSRGWLRSAQHGTSRGWTLTRSSTDQQFCS